MSGNLLSELIIDIIKKVEEIGLRVHSVTSDMGAANQGMWKTLGINATKYSKICNFIKHPSDESRKLWFFGDVPHALKNMKSGLLSNKCFIIPDSFVRKYMLGTNVVKASCLDELLTSQKNLEFMLTPKLNEQYLNTSNHFLKMRVSSATNVLSNDVSSAFQFLAHENGNEDYKTASWFIKYVVTWFNYMTARHVAIALGKLNLLKYQEAVNFLEESIVFFTKLKVGAAAAWKPFQKSCIMSTTSFLQISKYLLDERQFQFILSSRFSQDCIENLFCIIRTKQQIPNCVQFKNNLKLITISEFMKDISNNSYDEDDRNFLSEFLVISEEKKKESKKDIN